ncbi:dipeptidyl-peptidase 3 [Trichoderma gamsii]|uniref:Dipeptidyl-peptidase 3 n=1 Tax=Trichoderma gamsii TaxID=398673 RepID=A0A2P4ZTR6_9HYPO|nr:dipeptidyl-peptidase 3 [Trichoderma gamsii]PON27672.1 dipeptidyl-peptidase 3 [Trichoderma gamsii]
MQSLNNGLLRNVPLIGKGTRPQVFFAHSSSVAGSLSTVILLPETCIAVVVLVNSKPTCDSSDFITIMILERLLGGCGGHDFAELTREALDKASRRYSEQKAELESSRVLHTSPKPLNEHRGRYSWKSKSLFVDVFVEDDKLKFQVMGRSDQIYGLEHYHYDTFAWLMTDDEEAERARYVQAIGAYKFVFQTDDIDRVTGFKEAIFAPHGSVSTKTCNTVEQSDMLNIQSSAAWLGARIILRQVSPEASSIYDFVIELHRSCSGDWNSLIGNEVNSVELQALLTYMATFLSNVGNYYGSGDQKFIPSVDKSLLHKLATRSTRSVISAYIESFETGSLDAYRKSQRLWVRDKAPRVENIFGFVEPYRDPQGVRAEFEALVAIADDKETLLLTKLVDNSARFIRWLPWATPKNDGKGPFEKSLFEPPDCSSIHALAYCSSIIFPGINLPNYNDIRQEDGFKNVIISNRMIAESQAIQYPLVEESEAEQFKKHRFHAYYWWVVLHELLGHGTGQMMVENADGQTWTGQFGDLATTVDECRAEFVGAYLMDDSELLALFGFTDSSEICAEDLTYNLYLQLGVDGLRGLSNYNVQSNNWGQAHSRAHFAILKCLLQDGGGVITVAHNKLEHSLKVRVDRSKIRTHGKPALGNMLLHLHMFRCTADTKGCRTYYEKLSSVNGEYIEWRETVLATKPPPLIFTQANTFLGGDTVTLKEYEPTAEGVIASWAERQI